MPGYTAFENKAAALIHMLPLESGEELRQYTLQVVATISDQGQRLESGVWSHQFQQLAEV